MEVNIEVDFDVKDMDVPREVQELEKLISLNLSQWEQSEDPKFYELSEVDLCVKFKEISNLTAYIEKAETFIKNSGIELILQLMEHPNEDLKSIALKMLEELLEIDQLVPSITKTLIENKAIRIIDSCIEFDVLTGFELMLKLIDIQPDVFVKDIVINNYVIPSILKNIDSEGDVSVTASELLYTIITEAVQNEYLRPGVDRLVETGTLGEIVDIVMRWTWLSTEEDKECYSFLISTIKNFLEVPKSIAVVQ